MSSADQEPTADTGRRKFDEVASLFGPIVPPAGSPVRPRVLSTSATLPQVSDSELDRGGGPKLASPPPLSAPPAEPLKSRPAAATIEPGTPKAPPEPVIAKPAAVSMTPTIKLAPMGSAVRPESSRASSQAPNASARPAVRAERKPADVPWPDAFAPRPNYEPVQKARWLYWLFLIPFAAVVAVAITFIDPRSIRELVDQTLPKYLPAEVAQFFARPAPAPVVPETFPPSSAPPASEPAPASERPAADTPPTPPAPPALPAAPGPPVDTPPAATAPEPPAAATGMTPNVGPAPSAPDVGAPAPSEPAPSEPAPSAFSSSMPTPTSVAGPSPVPEPATAGTAVPPTPPASPPAAPGTVVNATRVTVYYKRNEFGSESEARRLAAKIANAEIKPAGSTSRSPMIYFSQGDREVALTIARTLAGEGSPGWIVRPGPSRQSAGTIDILLP